VFGLYGKPKRIHVASAKDIANIEMSFGLNLDGKRHHNYSTSVLLWVEEMKDLGDRNPILFCEISESSDNFMLAMQTPLQVATNA